MESLCRQIKTMDLEFIAGSGSNTFKSSGVEAMDSKVTHKKTFE